MKRWLGITLAAVVVTAAIPILWGGSAAYRQLLTVPPGWLFLMVGLVFAGWNINALRLRLLLGGGTQELSHHHALVATMATECAFASTPGGAGAPFTLVSLLQRHQIRPAQASAVFAVDQMMDLLFFLLALPFLIGYGVDQLTGAPGWVMGGVVVGQVMLVTVAVLAFRYHRAFLRRSATLLRQFGIPQVRRRRWARAQLAFSRAVHSTLVISPWRLCLAFGFCIAHWLLRYSLLYLAILALGRHLDWPYTFFVQMLSLAAGHLTFLPGGSGGTEVTSAALLAPWLSAGTVGAAILIWRSMSYYLYLLVGGLTLATVTGRRLWLQIAEG